MVHPGLFAHAKARAERVSPWPEGAALLTGLSIRDVVLIESLDLEFGPGLGVLTGETGAGKSILLDALGLALGARADSALVRRGQAQAVVSVSFELPPGHPACALLRDNGLAG